MDIIFYLLVIPVAVYFVVRRLDDHYDVNGNRWLLLAACILFGISLFFPSPIIDGEDTEFYTHLFGGGVFAGLLWLYFLPVIKSQSCYIELLQLIALVSVLGVANELFEILTHSIGLNPKSLNDTPWDLLANTLGVLLFYAVYRVIKYLKRLFIQR